MDNDIVLPTKLSDLIRVAAKDLESVMMSQHYVVDMSSWHEPAQGTCYVCYAGAVMARTLGAPSTQNLEPRSMGSNAAQLEALDEVRLYEISCALEDLGVGTEKARHLHREYHKTHPEPRAYKGSDTFQDFFDCQMELAQWLEERGQ